ncbi:MAG: Deoxycytidine triphosphate deaminase [Alphaproteobacteria bacterium MarineAlpha5_Bin6]|nr:MAG: Deoxycytidine triphosphate deaminase [Alphaproteobacteria bacterium MarineAlpha5_Bin7]PPR53948.1 MAG: Deoxycytidine triphosphate deaminase [Alphaproteobacteria bacterium MarineAlpha5_Bin6]|tara:strand:+ start:5212 stop:6300 length:1089 start_codon:yes stop_codon:yes gene_type:complete
MNKGSLTHKDYAKLLNNNKIINNHYKKSQIQPSSLDLTLSEEAYEVKASFLSPNGKIRDKLKTIFIKKIDLNNIKIFKKNVTYIVKLNEKLNLSNKIFGKCNPKSSTGRLDIFCRTILDYSDEYEKIPRNYQGEIFLEITSRSFDIILKKGDSLNQMRLIYEDNDFINDASLIKLHNSDPIIFNPKNTNSMVSVDSGLKIGVDLNDENNISAFQAKKSAPVLDFNKIKKHKVLDYWIPLKSKNSYITIKPGKFYILKSKQKIRIPPNMAGEMVPYDTGIGDFRVHYAGFFDPGFGDPGGSYAVLEIKTNEVPFILEDGQVIARIKYERLNKKSKVVYGSNIKSNYQNQGLALSKHFDLKSIL